MRVWRQKQPMNGRRRMRRARQQQTQPMKKSKTASNLPIKKRRTGAVPLFFPEKIEVAHLPSPFPHHTAKDGQV